MIICGTFIFLAAVPQVADVPWGLRPWMVVVVVGRELLVTAIRSFIEEQGLRFLGEPVGQAEDGLAVRGGPGVADLSSTASARPAAMTGRVPVDGPAWITWTAVISLWAAVVQTVYSGLIYVVAAVRLVRSSQ